MTYDGSSSAVGVTIYVDGRPILTEVKADRLSETIQNNAPLHIGMRNTAYPFQGRIDDVRIYNRLLSKAEVEQLFQAGLQSLVAVPAEKRTPEQQALLAATYRPQDEPLVRLQSQLAAAETALREARWDGVRRWYVNGQEQTMVVIPNPAELGDSLIDHSFAISSHEVTVAEYRRFREQHDFDQNVAPTDDCPVHYVNWFSAAEYCNWLSEQDGVPEDQWVYEPNDSGKYADGMKIKDNALELRGYRLPTRAEWEYA